MMKLKFGQGNAKLSVAIATFSLPAGFACPFAKDCRSQADRITGKIMDGKHTQYRCFAASQEALFKSVRNARWYNMELLKGKSLNQMTNLIHNSLPKGISTIRVHVSGDFFSETYFLAWLNVAMNNPFVIFYGYTKALSFIVKHRNKIPNNFRFTASKGGTMDKLIKIHKLKYAEVVFSVKEAKEKNLELDHDDSLAVLNSKSFGLLLHGTQPSHTRASEALKELRKVGIRGYTKNGREAFNSHNTPKIFITA